MKLFMKEEMEKPFLEKQLIQSNFEKLLRQILIDNYKASLEQGTNNNAE